VTVARILIWNLADSKTSIDEVRERLPGAPEGVVWIANEPEERFGIVTIGDELPDLEPLSTLIGKHPDIAEEFDVV
jgi:hypothetical protein